MTIEKITSNFYKVEIPLPNSPLRWVNSYVIKGSKRHLIIDPGMKQERCLSVMKASLDTLGIDLNKTDFFITHFHPDHLGLVSSLVTQGSTIYLTQPDADRLQKILYGTLWAEMVHYTVMNGFPEADLQEVTRIHPTKRFGLKDGLVFKGLTGGDKIQVGAYSFQCIKTPGHTKGHMCLHETTKKILVAGDHILNEITPNISLRSDKENPLKAYLESLKEIDELKNVDLVLPGHGTPFHNYRRRIRELESHHHERAEELLLILKKASQDAYRLASQLRWNVSWQSWEEFPPFQKWIAVGEVMAHLKYLQEQGKVRKEMQERSMVFSLG